MAASNTVLFRTTWTILLTGAKCISCHQVGGDHVQTDHV